MNNIWLLIFTGSLTALCIIILRIRLRWIRVTLINMALAAVLLFAMNQVDLFGTYALPVNVFTVGTTGLLGLPGIVLLFGLKLMVIR